MPDTTKEAELDWARAQIKQYREVYPTYAQFAETLRQILQKAAKEYAPEALVQARPKALASFTEKIQRKKSRYRDPVHQITDLCGGRVITHTPDEVKAVCEFIEKHFQVDWANSLDVSERLKPTEFGYRSVHYIVQFKPGVFPTRRIDVAIPDTLLGLKAEIQVRTLLEHAWGDFAHDRAYKGAFQVPANWLRELAGLAAMLEGADRSFARIQTGLQTYATSYGEFLTAEQVRAEIELLELVLENDPDNAQLADRIGKLAMVLGDWPKAIAVLSPQVDSGYQPLLRDLGVAICKLYEARPTSPEYRQGQAYLEAASAPPQRDADALASLAGTWKGIDEGRARELYHQAFETDPSDPYALSRYLEYEIAERKDASLVALMRMTIQKAIQRCLDQIEVGMNLPWAYYDLAKFHLLLGEPYQCLAAYAKAIDLTKHTWMIQTSLTALERLQGARDQLPGYEWAKRLLIIALACRCPNEAAWTPLRELATPGCEPIEGPVVVVAGGTRPSNQEELEEYEELLLDGFREFKGTIISGGTTARISSIVGELQQKFPEAIKTIGYVPHLIPPEVSVDERYQELRYTPGNGFSALEPLQYWTDLLASGILPNQVRLLGIGGGVIAGAEYRIALALGAQVALVEGSGREVARLAPDKAWRSSRQLLNLPPDAITVKSFIMLDTPRLDPESRETIARALHEAYRDLPSIRARTGDPSLADWEMLPSYFQESNRHQADHLVEKLRAIGCTTQYVEGREAALMKFTSREIEIMAEMEHGRWMVERLQNGWNWGEKTDLIKKTSPHLVSWADLPEKVKEQNRETVRKIPELLAKIGLEVRR